MPNHVYTNMSIEGTEEEVQNFFVTHFTERDGESYFDFETFYPMPEELKGTRAPSNLPADESKALVDKYGVDNWYAWCINHWGTKWNTYDNCIHDDNNISFQTAWSLPDPIFARMAELYPSMTFNIKCVEDGGFFAGTILISEGVVESAVTEDFEEWREYACDILGWCESDDDDDDDG